MSYACHTHVMRATATIAATHREQWLLSVCADRTGVVEPTSMERLPRNVFRGRLPRTSSTDVFHGRLPRTSSADVFRGRLPRTENFFKINTSYENVPRTFRGRLPRRLPRTSSADWFFIGDCVTCRRLPRASSATSSADVFRNVFRGRHAGFP